MPHNLKLLPKEKVQLIQRCLKGEISGREASQITGMGSTTISQRIAQYKANGAEAFLTPSTKSCLQSGVKTERSSELSAGWWEYFGY